MQGSLRKCSIFERRLATYRIRRIPKCHPKILQNRLQNQQKINVGSLCKACSSTSRSLKGPRIHFRALGSPKWSQHGAKRAPKMEPKSMPKSISSRSGVSGGLGRASGRSKPPFGHHSGPISVPNRLHFGERMQHTTYSVKYSMPHTTYSIQRMNTTFSFN